jgi:branched-chain amino acid transport system ATP-binding protein
LESSEAILQIKNIEVKYHEVILVLKGVSIEVPRGGIVALLGANGAGKSTTLKAISGLLKTEDGEVTDGAIEFQGRRIHHERAANIAKMGIVQVIEGRRVFEHLTVEENLRVGAHLRKTGPGDRLPLFPKVEAEAQRDGWVRERWGAADDRCGKGLDDGTETGIAR